MRSFELQCVIGGTCLWLQLTGCTSSDDSMVGEAGGLTSEDASSGSESGLDGSSSDAEGSMDDADADSGGSSETSPDGDDAETESAQEDSEAGDEGIEPPDPRDAVDEAIRAFPDYASLHRKVIARTCSPDAGVCHNNKEYPDLRTPLSMLAVVERGCNLGLEDIVDSFNGCEGPGDRIEFLYGNNAELKFEIAYFDFVMGDTGTELHLELDPAIPEAMRDPAKPENIAISRLYGDANDVLDVIRVYNRAVYEEGSSRLRLIDIDALNDTQQAILSGELRSGDPNRDGVFGAREPGFMEVAPGDPDRSYLLARLQATVPGTPMPLANQALSSAEMLAVQCWIEGLIPGDAPQVDALIDYDTCQAAEDFGEGDPDSGHSLDADVQPIFDRHCNAGGCHDRDTAAAELDLSRGRARAQLLRPAAQDAATPRVVPGNPTSSYLMMKLWGTGVEGTRMPRPFAGQDADELPEADMAVIERWIIAGAPDD